MKLKDFRIEPGIIRLSQVTQRFPRERKLCHLDIDTNTKRPAISFLTEERRGRTLVTVILTATDDSYQKDSERTNPTRIRFSLPGTHWTFSADGSRYDYSFTALRRERRDYTTSRILLLEE